MSIYEDNSISFHILKKKSHIEMRILGGKKMNLTNFIPEMNQEKPKVYENIQPKTMTISEITNQNNIWTEVDKFIEKCKTNKDNFAYLIVEFKIQSTLNEIKEWLYITSTMERLFKNENDSYGGFWGIEDVEQLNTFYQDVLEFKRKLCNVPYKKEIMENFILTDVHSDNIKVFFSNEVEEYLKRNRIDVDKLKTDFENIKTREVTEEDIKLAERFYSIQKEIEELEKTEGLLDKIDTAIRAKAGIKKEFSNKIPICPFEYVNLPVNDLIELKNNTSGKLKMLKSKEEKIRNSVNQDNLFP